MKKRIFFSHSSKDKELARRIANDLSNKGISVWFDEWELTVGDSLQEKISSGIQKSSWLAVLLTKNSVKSKWVRKELNAALSIELERDKVFVLPIRADNCPIPIFLKEKVYADFREGYSEGINAILKTVLPKGKSERARVEKEEKFFNTISDIAIRLYAAPAGEIELDEPGNITGKEFLNRFIKEMGLNPGDYFTATFLLINGTKITDNSKAIQAVKDFWTVLFLRTRTEPYNIIDKLDLYDEFRSFLRAFWEFAGLPPLDFFTADFVLEAGRLGRLDGNLKSELIANEVKNFWSDMIDLYGV